MVTTPRAPITAATRRTSGPMPPTARRSATGRGAIDRREGFAMRIPRSGFTLFELVLVMVLLVIVGALSYPSLSSMYGGFKVTAAADEVRSAWAQARAHAINEGTPYRFAVVPGKGNYRIAPDVESYWAGQGGQQAPEDPTVRPLVMQ